MHACEAATQSRARCRHNAVPESILCAMHKKAEDEGVQISRAPKPDVVLYKFNINPAWKERFLLLGVKEENYDTVAKEAKHVAHAEAYRREAYAVRKDVADSGVQVFGSEGLKNVVLSPMIRELAAAYSVVGLHIRPRRDQSEKMSVLVVSFAQTGEATTNKMALQLLLEFSDKSSWGFCHVWANPPQLEDGRIIHTVNSGHRQDLVLAGLALHFAGGLWAETAL